MVDYQYYYETKLLTKEQQQEDPCHKLQDSNKHSTITYAALVSHIQ